jgi:hypothetical protein
MQVTGGYPLLFTLDKGSENYMYHVGVQLREGKLDAPGVTRYGHKGPLEGVRFRFIQSKW